MTYKVFMNGKLINTVDGSEQFLQTYCRQYGYTYEAIEEAPLLAPTPTTEDLTLDLLAEHEERICMLEILQP